MDQIDDESLRKSAERRADAKLAFRSHLTIYLVVNAGLAAINLLSSPGNLWFLWPMIGWGIGLVAHGMATYAWTGDVREQMVQKEMDRLRATRR